MSTPEQRLREEVRLGEQAREVIDNPAFVQAFGAIEEELMQAWKASPQRDEEGRERLFQCLTMLGKVRTALERSMESGKLCLLTLRHDNPTMRQQAKEWLAS